ncbi:MAG TPA: ATP-binding protein, partial [Streptomyces sp.]|nr:ATP-binding protein [Streptomyces sp.]
GAFVVARSMIRSLRRLEETATRVAQDRLPELVKQLSESDPQDVDTSVESVGVHSRDEIGQVARAFEEVHREAVRLAAEQALLRGNVNAMFTNLSRRSQGLIQRQLSLISELESREADPDQLSSLFKLDHLATRMRRNGENLLVLAGEEPGRRWTRPVPLVDVLRAAASEVEQYERIELAAVPTTEVAGRVVNDLVHLLAELLENATSFSSPQTKVKVTGHALPDGRVLIEIHDTGIGLSPEDLASINERLASPPTVDVSVSRRMGLFVVGRLSQRHGIRIQLRPSDSGGTTALVMLPVDVAQGGKKPQPKGQPSAGGPAAAQASAGVAAARRAAAQGGGRGSGGPGSGSLGPGPGNGSFGSGPGGGSLLGSGSGGPGLLGIGQSPRAALPGRDGGHPGAPGGPGGAPGPQSPAGPQHRPAPADAGAAFGTRTPVSPQGVQPAGPNGPQGGDQDLFGGQRGGNDEQTRRPQLPARGGPRAELPGGTTQPSRPSWSDENAQPPVPRSPLDAPRGHDDQDSGRTPRMPRHDDRQGVGSTAEMPVVPRHDERQGAGSTAEFARPDYSAPAPGGPETQQGGAPFVRPDVFGSPSGPSARDTMPSGGLFPAGQAYDAGSADQFAGPVQDGGSTGRHVLPGRGDGADASPYQDGFPREEFQRPAGGAHGGQDFGAGSGFRGGSDFGAPRPPAPQQRPSRPEPEALPPAAGPGDGRTPLFDRLETNWFHGGGRQEAQEREQHGGSAPLAPQQSETSTGPQRSGAAAPWRSSPNDDLVRQAERVRQPAAGGVTTSGLPRRVPRANLVPGTAQQQPHQTGPQVSRAPDDVRGRLTNLRRGIAQGRQAGSGQTGSFPRPTHQQER